MRPTASSSPPARTSRVLLVAHRAGNDPETARQAADRADLVELDAHVFRGRVEVRHAKVLRPSARLWERWYLLPRRTPVVALDAVLAALPADVPLLVDLKCYRRAAARRIAAAIPTDRTLTVAARSWWVLAAFTDRPGTVRLRSCGGPNQYRIGRRLPGLGATLGLVVHERLLHDAAAADAVRRRTPHLFSWGVTTPGRARELVQLGVTGLIVDDLDLDWPTAASAE